MDTKQEIDRQMGEIAKASADIADARNRKRACNESIQEIVINGLMELTDEEKLPLARYLYWHVPEVDTKTLTKALGVRGAIADIVGPSEEFIKCSICARPITVKSRAELKDKVAHTYMCRCEVCKKEQQERENRQTRGPVFIRETRNEARLIELKTMPYKEYLTSPEWKNTRQTALQRSGFRCQLCNRPGELNVHHRTYERLGEERNSDLIVLCSACHKRHHKDIAP